MKLKTFLITTALLISAIPHSASAAGAEYKPFTDTDSEEIEILSRCGIISGYDDGSFRPQNTVTRAEAVSIIINTRERLSIDSIKGSMEEFPEQFSQYLFSDLDKSHWAYPAVFLASESLVVNGYDDGSFRPSDNVTEEQLIKMAVCACGYNNLADIEGYPYGYVKRAKLLGLCDSADDTPATREYTAHVAYKLLSADAQIIDSWTFNSDGTISMNLITRPFGVSESNFIAQVEGKISAGSKEGTVNIGITKNYTVPHDWEPADYGWDPDEGPGTALGVPYSYADIIEKAGKTCYIYIAEDADGVYNVVYAKEI